MTEDERYQKAKDFVEVRMYNVSADSVYESLDIDPYDQDAVPNEDAEAIIELISTGVFIPGGGR